MVATDLLKTCKDNLRLAVGQQNKLRSRMDFHADATLNANPTRHASDEALDAARTRIREIIRQHDINDK
jgi:hypothetical protein